MTTGNPQNAAQIIADALHDLEAHTAKGKDKKAHAKVCRLHRVLHEAALDHAPTLGIDIAPLSGGGLKP